MSPFRDSFIPANTSHGTKEINKMQSETANFAPVPPAGELYETTHRLIRANSLHYMEKWRHPRNRKYITYRNAIRGGSSHNHKNWWNSNVWFLNMWTDRQTNKQTNKQTYRHA